MSNIYECCVVHMNESEEAIPLTVILNVFNFCFFYNFFFFLLEFFSPNPYEVNILQDNKYGFS